jgi:hypothetical protein
MPNVWNVRNMARPADAVYIGRRTAEWPASKWGNPYRIGRNATREEREGAIEQYQQHLIESGLINDVHELRGRDLLCWCAPDPCHGDLLLALANNGVPIIE